ncbi:hypothetical protein NC797_10700 [Aquibacillus sp. 3ASR75-11]|uniref:Uncharacterized protein n=1 Tax=Terrihalobacillus insolitus TaxID=2950438 RepID=A0A9X4AMM0_9BACI|nr:hypothetical protein [Terrihalobacillus insolitus]MDC3413391.1 hypothetical protein [Terrihalobacillus insolitus]MDC3424974.1 hypothetical protein [Terrihalobacillus insolitus]
MNKWILTVIGLLSLFVISFLFMDNEQSVIKYFPLDEEKKFTKMSSSLQLLSQTDQDEYDVSWTVTSEMEESIYLRQDVSLLFVDGQLQGILSKWKENGQNLTQKLSIHGEDSSHFQIVSFHHGEIHYPDDEIKSIQGMTQDELYVIDSPYSALESFEQPTDANQKDWKKTLDRATNQQLSFQWEQLLNYFNIPDKKYTIVPLTKLTQFETKPIPGLNQEQTEQVIGQLWEGLYKNYVLEISSNMNENQPIKSYIPLILFDKEAKHLLVLYQDQNGNKKQLIQYYPFSSN